MINRLIEPEAGTVSIDGRDAATFPEHVLRRRIGYVLQSAALFPHMSVRENLALPLELMGWEEERIDDRVREIMTLVEIDATLAARAPSELSGGQAQRVGLGRAIAAEPDIVLLDEPFGALDPLTRDRLQQSFSTLRRSLGLTIVLVTHDMSEAIVLADRIGVMHRGELVQLGTPSELLRSPATPYVESLLDSPRRHARAFDALAKDAAS